MESDRNTRYCHFKFNRKPAYWPVGTTTPASFAETTNQPICIQNQSHTSIYQLFFAFSDEESLYFSPVYFIPPIQFRAQQMIWQAFEAQSYCY